MRWPLTPAVVMAALLSLTAREARAQQCLANVPHIDGTWKTLPYAMPINPITATLLYTGDVLIVAGSENDASNNSPGAESYRAAVWDPTGTTSSSVAVQNLQYDVFCSGTAVLPDGRPLIVGGTSDYSFAGEYRATIFDPATLRFIQGQRMVDGRWYATATELGDGRIMAWSGLNLAHGVNSGVEIYDLRSAGTGWAAPLGGSPTPSLYPRTFVLPDGRVFWTGQGFDSQDAHSWFFDPNQKTWTSSAANTGYRANGSAVLLPLLPPSYRPRVMNFGGGNPATSTTETIDLGAASPAWTPGPPMSTGRIQMNAVILPDGSVLAEGGSVNNEAPDAPGRHADLYDPSSNTMASGGTAAFSRLYHSTALLLPDATVASLGSNPGDRGSYQPAIEIYTPAYLYDSKDQLITNRPQITGVSPLGPLGYGATMSVTFSSASPIASAVLVKPGSSTHAFDMDQRLIGLCGAAPQPACAPSGGTLSLKLPPNGNIAPPGYYMLFLLDAAGVPSHAEFIQLSPYATSAPLGGIASPAGDVTINAGSAVSFSASTSAAKYSWVFPGGSPSTSTAQNPGPVTFSTPGQYVISFTEIDASGNSDPSPPTRTIKVLPNSADFDIAVSPSSQTIFPGQSAQFSVKVTPLTGFGGSVALAVGSESGFPAGITSAGFSPSSIAGSGTSVLTMNAAASTTPYALSLTVTGTSGTLRHTASTTFVVALARPGSPQATAGNGSAALSWQSVAAATGYHVRRSTIPGGPYLTVGCPASTSFTDTGLTNGTKYYYVVSALYTGGPDSGGESADSTEISVTPQGSAPPPPPPGTGTGLTGTYFDNIDFTGTTITRLDPQVSFDWGSGSPNPAIGVDTFSVRWTGQVQPLFSETYTFTTRTDDGVRLWVNGQLIVDSWIDQAATEHSGTITLTAGTKYDLRMDYYENGGGAVAQLFWQSASQPRQLIPTSQLYPAAAPAVPEAPKNLSASRGSAPRTIKLNWTQSTGSALTQNKIYRRTLNGTYPSAATATISPGTSYLDSGLNAKSTYCYRVTAVNAGGESAKSNESCATTK